MRRSIDSDCAAGAAGSSVDACTVRSIALASARSAFTIAIKSSSRARIARALACCAAIHCSAASRRLACSGNRVVVLGTQRWHVHATGRTYDDDWVHLFTIESGKIATFVEYHDTEAEAAAHRP
ncbi:hypothetical protein LGM71_16345 [Burkholderia sp. AU33545]|uniref:nuclear transport factor 2 family protein n=1 Tax=Burkholderia sp. AU33545 TaxID=2879631 RepID=UPI001CF4C10A|nr:hypothetical protein [Burkholderia sp. AU33545]MCA8202630.1 hypothetical protein [Burkholderia sp. AU33545]